MDRVWTLVGLVAAVAALLFLVFVIESEINAKISELKKRHQLRKLEKELDKAINNFNTSNDEFLKMLEELGEEEENNENTNI